jgi:hypothetical protein
VTDQESPDRIFRGQFAGARDRARLSVQIERIRAWALARDWFTVRAAREDLERPASCSRRIRSARNCDILGKPSAGRLRCEKEKRHRGGGVWEYRLRAIPVEISAPAATLRRRRGARKSHLAGDVLSSSKRAGYGYTGRAKDCS